VPGASVTVKHSGSTVASGTTDANGNFALALAAGSYTADVSGSRLTGVIGHAFTLPGGVVVITTTPNPSYDCGGGFGCATPLVPTLHLTDSVRGITATLPFNSGVAEWVSGCYAFNYTAGTWADPSCPSATGCAVVYHFDGRSLYYETACDATGLCPVSAPCNPLLWTYTLRHSTSAVITACPTSAFLCTGGGYTLTE
jgi:hypothetical protein